MLINVSDYLAFCNTDKQRHYIETYVKEGTFNKAAKELGVNKRTFERVIARVKRNAAIKGFSPEHSMLNTVPDPYVVKGVSTLYNGKGMVAAQWVKSTLDQEKYAKMMQDVVVAMSENIKPEKPIVCSRINFDENLVNTYVITDYHLGMKSWWEETGDNWDTDIAEDLLVKWFQIAIKQAPDAETAIFAQLGDFLHWDGLDAVTPTSKNLLDADTRFQLIVRVAIRVIRRIVKMLLAKHNQVHLIMAEGNHDPASSIWLRELFVVLYEDEPRVTVDDSADPYYCYEHGETSIFFHHGHKRKVENLDTVLVAKFRDVFGRTSHSYAHVGHLHHIKVNETNLMVVEQHRTLAAADAYASRGGWMSGRDAKIISYHKEYGEVSRISVSPDMVR